MRSAPLPARRRTFTAVDLPAVQFDDIGNSALKPERTTEFEGGFEARLLNNRATHRPHVLSQAHEGRADQRDHAAVGRLGGDDGTPEPRRRSEPRVGVAVQHADGPARVVRCRPHAQRVDELRTSCSTSAARRRRSGRRTRVVEGYPLFGWWARQIRGWEDKNSDGILTYNANAALNEVFVDDVGDLLAATRSRATTSRRPAASISSTGRCACRRCSTTAADTTRTTTPSAFAA